ncbi:hypothetical protein [Shewanella sp. NIFS-20-20]|uniref:hypothetical protein n=1 Tax=Shewanella sp. NIFS-20-20 TaxID=2853806 RepID=UPI001C46D8B9|nr:hypothetical protein [Shewanella sp. NIFS-20-20]MBV7317504.1 hypothetical protein [Shewanella sp. NIFS-20-20]
MKGWIIIGSVCAVLYYTATTTSLLDEPIHAGQSLLNSWHSQIKSLTGTKITKVDQQYASLKQELATRLSKSEMHTLSDILKSPEAMADFSQQYCQSSNAKHPMINKDNLRFVCDHL